MRSGPRYQKEIVNQIRSTLRVDRDEMSPNAVRDFAAITDRLKDGGLDRTDNQTTVASRIASWFRTDNGTKYVDS